MLFKLIFHREWSAQNGLTSVSLTPLFKCPPKLTDMSYSCTCSNVFGPSWLQFITAFVLMWRLRSVGRMNPGIITHSSSPPLSPVCHCRALSLALGQGEATFSQVELQSPSLHQPVRRLQDLRSQGLWLGPLVGALAAPRSRFGHDTPWGRRRLGLLTDAIQVFHRVFASFTSSGTTTTGKHC